MIENLIEIKFPDLYNKILKVYLGGVPEKFGRSHHHKTLSLPDIATTANYIGCLKNVSYKKSL